MKNILLLSAFTIMMSCTSIKSKVQIDNTLSKNELKAGWQLLFDGKSTNGWRSANKSDFPTKGWEIKEGCLVSLEGGGSIVSLQEYGNFDFTWDWKMETVGGNSGIKYFVKEADNNALGIEYQMLDDMNHEWMKDGRMKPNDYHTVGAVYELFSTSPSKISKPVGEWNQSRVISDGMKVEHWLNGVKVAEYIRGSDDFNKRVAQSKFKDVRNFGLHPKGLIMLTDHGSVVYFKNMKLRKL